jgi:hypothetical protein
MFIGVQALHIANKENKMQEIIIDGVNLNEMKAKHDALQKEMQQARNSIRQGASKFIAEKIAEGKKLVEELLDDDFDGNVDDVASRAYDLLSAASFVSEVSGVTYTLPYYDRQSDYHPYGDPYTVQIDEVDNDAINDNEAVGKLYALLENMESDVSDWLTSYC